MLIRNSLIVKYFVRKVRAQPIKKPQGAEKVKFSQQQLSKLGQASANQRMSVKSAFQEKYSQKHETLQQLIEKRQRRQFEKKTVEQKRKQFHNKQLPKSTPKQERIQPQQMSLSDLASVRLHQQFLPTAYLKQAQKIFHKYGQGRLRQIAQNFSKLMTLRYRQQKFDYDQYQNLKFQRLEQKVPSQKKVQQIYLIGQQKIYDQNEKVSAQIRKTDTQSISPQISYTQNIAISYLLNRTPRTFSTAVRLMTEIKYKYPDFKPKSFLDFGSGLSSGACAFIDIFQDSGEVYCVQPAAKMRKLAKFLTQGSKIRFFQSLGEMSTQIREVDVVYAGYVINQIRPQLVQVYLQALYTKVKNQGFLVLAEYGSPFGSRLIHQARKWAITKGMYISAPCPHHLKCPLTNSSRWCHFDQPSGIYPKNVFGKLPTDQAIQLQKYSYLILQKKQPISDPIEQKIEPNVTKQWDRVVFPIMRRGKHVVMDLCTKQGLFQRRISAKSHGLEYRQAKRLRWGDYWRFGKRIPNKFRKQRKTGRRLW